MEKASHKHAKLFLFSTQNKKYIRI